VGLLRPGAQEGAGHGGVMQAQQVVLVIAHVYKTPDRPMIFPV
jgi:hypothetical protein